jgi:hypothetical protein
MRWWIRAQGWSMQDVGGDFENSSGRASRSTDCELPGRFGRYPIHCHPPPSPDPGQELRTFHFRPPPSFNTGQERGSFYCRLPLSLNTGREGRNVHCYPPPSPDPGRRRETHCHKPVNKEKKTSLRIKTLYSTHWGSLCFLGHRFLFLFLFSLTIILLFFCHGPTSPQNSLCSSALNLEPFGYTLFTPLFGVISRDSLLHVSSAYPNWPREVYSHKPHSTFAYTRITFCGLDFLYCNSIAQYTPIPLGRF